MGKRNTVATERPFEMRTRTADQVLASVKDEAEQEVRFSKSSLDKFAERFNEDAAHALDWFGQTAEQAGRNSIAKLVLKYLEVFAKQNSEESAEQKSAKMTLEIMLEEFTAECMRRARWPEHSTSSVGNYMSICLNGARAEWIEKLELSLKKIGEEYKFYLD
jgi:hypothetical protein